MNLKRVHNVFVVTALTCSMMTVPVLAAPNTSSLEAQKNVAQGEVSTLQSQLNSLMGTMNELEGQLVSKGQEISQAEKELKAAEEKETQQYENMKLRIKYMYEEGDGSALERIFTSGSIAELLTEAEYIEKVHTYDRNMLQEYMDTVEEIDTLKTTLETDMSKLKGLEEDYKAQSEELSGMLNSKQAEVNNLDSMIQEAAKVALEEQKKQESEKKAVEQKKLVQQESVGEQSGSQGGNGSGTKQPTQDETAADSTGSDNSSTTSTPEPSYNASTGNTVVDRAYSWVDNAEYVWGACSPGAFDCSGFVSYCLTGSYSRLGTTFTFLTWPQVSDPQPGDVCVNAEHCGIYIGSGMMIHAATEGVGVISGPVQSGMIYVRY